jgi:hypothetical protein
MTILFTLHLYFAVGLFLNKKTRIIDVLGVIVFLELNAFFWSFIGVWKRWPKYIFNEALHVENVVRSTLSYPNETSKECIQFL